MAASVQEITDQSFQRDVLQNPLPVVVDFWAPWCGPCKKIEPIMEELAGEYAGRISVAKLDIATSPQTAATYGIRSIPALVFFKDGHVASSLIGAQPRHKIEEQIQRVIS
jgi:thioredoxin